MMLVLGRFNVFPDLTLFDIVFQYALIDISHFPFSARRSYLSEALQLFRSVSRAHYAGNSQLSTDNSSVACPPALVCYNSGGDFHDWLPVRIRHVGDKNLPLLELFDVAGIFYDMRRSGADLRAYRCPCNDEIPRFRKFVTFEDVYISLGLDGFGPGLQDKEFAGISVFAPFNIHGFEKSGLFRVVIFYDGGPPCKCQDLILSDTESFPFIFGNRNNLYRVFFVRGIDHLYFFGAKLFLEDRVESCLERGFEHIKFIGLTVPWTTISPRPYEPVSRTASLNPDSVSIEKITPEAARSERTIF